MTVRDADRNITVGTAVAGTTGSWEVRLRPGPTTQINNALAQSSAGGEARAVTTR